MRHRYVIEHYKGSIKIISSTQGFRAGKEAARETTKLNLSEEERSKKDEDNYKRSIRRTAKQASQIIRSNFGGDSNIKMLSLTYKDNMQNWNKLCLDWDRFRRQLHDIINDFRFCSVPERQDRGAWHLHVVTSFQYLEHQDLMSMWRCCIKGIGGVWISYKRNPNVAEAANYLTGYLTNTEYMHGQDYPIGKKRYWTNLRNLVKITRCNTIENVEEVLRIAKEHNLVMEDYTYTPYKGEEVRTVSIETGIKDFEPLMYSLIDTNDRLETGARERYFERKYSANTGF